MKSKIYLSILVLIISNSYSTAFSQKKDSLKIVEKKRKKFLKEYNYYRYIPPGTYSTSVSNEGEESKTEKHKVNEFYMYSTELSNIDYLEFLYHLKNNNSPLCQEMLPDTNVWITQNSYNQPYVEYYLRHPAYYNYPVVGVSYYQATEYCKWITEIFNTTPNKIFKEVKFRLPTEKEWIWAAKGGLENSPFPWGGPYVHNVEGDMLANCMYFSTAGVIRDTLYRKSANGEFIEVPIYRAQGGLNYLGNAGVLNDAADITAPCASYAPNGYGLFNMAGNVSEMVAEEGITHGGSWKDPGYYLQHSVAQHYSGSKSSSCKRGFRMVFEVIEY